MSQSPKIFSLKQVVSSIRKTIEDRYTQAYWVKAEMHKLNRYPSGHCFPELLQKEDGKIVAQITGSIWKHNFDRINQQFVNVAKEPLREGSTMLMQVKVAFHETYGMSLQILDIDPNYSLGELQRERQETLLRLQKEGLIQANQQLEFPLLPRRIAVISAASSKGLSDFMQVLEQNEKGYVLFTHLFPAYLQGDVAVPSIIEQLEKIKSVIDHFDVVVIVRGGGGEVGLSCYNNYNLCRAIASFPLPVLTGIGHSTNLTVAEMISYRNAITPTELADLFLSEYRAFEDTVNDNGKAIQQLARQLLKETNYQLEKTSNRFLFETERYLSAEKFQLASMTKAIVQGSKHEIDRNNQRLSNLSNELGVSSKRYTKTSIGKLDEFQNRIPLGVRSILKHHQNQLERAEQSVRLMDPINVLKRGYSITTFNGKTISEHNQPKAGSTIQTKTANFNIESTVTESNNE